MFIVIVPNSPKFISNCILNVFDYLMPFMNVRVYCCWLLNALALIHLPFYIHTNSPFESNEEKWSR